MYARWEPGRVSDFCDFVYRCIGERVKVSEKCLLMESALAYL